MIKIDIWPKIPQCPNCGNGMIIDDLYFQDEGCKDLFFTCLYCGSSCIERVMHKSPVARKYYNCVGKLIKYERK